MMKYEYIPKLVKLNSYLCIPGMVTAEFCELAGISASHLSRIRRHKSSTAPYEWEGLIVVARKLAERINPAFVSAMPK
jgi:hypothetical protein